MLVPELHLASQSPRRVELLEALGLRFTACGVDVDEVRLDDENPADMVLRLATAKAAAAKVDPAVVVLGADTAVVLGSRVFGKPKHRDEALTMLQRLSGQSHEVLTGVAVCNGGRIATRLSSTKVRFREIGPDEAVAYWQSGEPRDKAGAYAIQGRGGVFVEAIEGSYSGVVLSLIHI